MSASDAVQRAVDLAKEGKKAEARQILEGVISRGKDNPRAWAVLAQLAETHNEERYCLEQVLRIVPGNSWAKMRIERLHEPEPEPVPKPEPPPPPPAPSPQSIPPSQPVTRRKGTNWAGILLIILLGVCGVCSLLWFLGYVSGGDHEPTTYRVTYKVKGSASRASLTYENAEGGAEQADITVPWEKSFTFKRGDFVYISAQSNDDWDRTITCEIWVDGKKWKSSTSSGRFVIATCDGSVGRE
jgi:hypothetical protein